MYRFLLLFALCSPLALADTVDFITIQMDAVQLMDFGPVPDSFPINTDPGLEANGVTGVFSGGTGVLFFNCEIFIPGYGPCNTDAFFTTDFSHDPFMSIAGTLEHFIPGTHFNNDRSRFITITAIDPPSPTPEPGTLTLLLVALLVLAAYSSIPGNTASAGTAPRVSTLSPPRA